MNELELYHYGVKGQKWGVRRYQNKDGSLTPAGKKMRKKLEKQIWNSKGNFENRNKVYSKMTEELRNTEESRRVKDIVKQRGIIDQKGHVTTISYMKEDWSNIDKVMDKMVKDTSDMRAYKNKRLEIAKKYVDEVREATIKDLGYDNVKAGKEFLTATKMLEPGYSEIIDIRDL